MDDWPARPGPDLAVGGGAGPSHVPVLRDRVVALLKPPLDAGGVVVDATLGLGGHAEALLEATSTGRLVGLDRDAEALRLARARLAAHGDRLTVVQAVYDELPDVLAGLGLPAVAGVFFDLGVSSLQLDEPERGFSYARDAPLDMRMDRGGGPTAAEVVNSYGVEELTRVLREYGEERFAARIAAAILRARQEQPFTSTARLADVVRTAIPAATRRHGGHPAKRTFQALRIEVNGELAALDRALPAALAALSVGGRLVVLAYHSLEDRLVKRAVTDGLRGCVCPPELPSCACGREPYLRSLVRGSESPGDAELAANPRASSVRLRAVERTREAA